MTSTVQLAAGSYDNITSGNENKLPEGVSFMCVRMSVFGRVRKCTYKCLCASVPSLYWYTYQVLLAFNQNIRLSVSLLMIWWKFTATEKLAGKSSFSLIHLIDMFTILQSRVRKYFLCFRVLHNTTWQTASVLINLAFCCSFSSSICLYILLKDSPCSLSDILLYFPWLINSTYFIPTLVCKITPNLTDSTACNQFLVHWRCVNYPVIEKYMYTFFYV